MVGSLPSKVSTLIGDHNREDEDKHLNKTILGNMRNLESVQGKESEPWAGERKKSRQMLQQLHVIKLFTCRKCSLTFSLWKF